MSSTLGVRQWFPAAAAGASSAAVMTEDLARHAREFGIAFVGDDEDEDGILKKECMSPSAILPPIPPLIPLSSIRQVNSVVATSDDSNDHRLSEAEPGGYGGIFMVNSDSAAEDHGECVLTEEEENEKLLRMFGDSDEYNDAISAPDRYGAMDERLHSALVSETDISDVITNETPGDCIGGDVSECQVLSPSVKVTSGMCSDEVCCTEEASRCTVVLDPLPTDLLRSLTEDGRISAEKAARTCCHSDWEHNIREETLPLCSRRSSSESAVRGLLQDLVSAVATQEGRGVREEFELARSQRQESLLHQPPPPPSSLVEVEHENRRIDYENVEDDIGEESHDLTLSSVERRARHRKSETPRKAVRRRRERRSCSSGGKSKRRKRSTSCSTTSSTGSSTSYATHHHHHHHHHHKHHKHRRRSKNSADEHESASPPPTPRVNPIFVWVKQDDTRIVEVLCEDYDKRNRIRLTKTPHGWRAIPRTERLATANSILAQTVPDTTAGGSSTCNRSLEAPLDEQHDTQPLDGSIDQYVTSMECSNDIVGDEKTSDFITKDEIEMEDEIYEENEMEQGVEEECPEAGEDSCDNLAHETVPSAEECAEEECIEEQQEEDCTYTEIEELEPTDLSIPKTMNDLEDMPKTVPLKTVLPAAPTLKPKQSPIQVAQTATPVITPAHQTKPKSMFLESLLSSPRKCDQSPKLCSKESTNESPLDLGLSFICTAGSPTVSCSDERKTSVRPTTLDPKVEPKPKYLKLEDITLKNLLNKHSTVLNKTVNNFNGVTKVEKTSPTQTSISSSKGNKSRLLELLTAEPVSVAEAVSFDLELNPVNQLKKVLSDPELAVPDPLLVPRDCLHRLVTNPAKEIPHLLTTRPELRLPEALGYPGLLRDPDLLVISLAHLEKLLQKPESGTDDEATTCITLREWQRYQQPTAAREQDSHVKQQQQQQNQNGDMAAGDLDLAAAAALHQMFWLPYLTQLEASAMACGNTQEFLSMLNAVFPSSNYPQVQGVAGQQQQQQQQQYPFLSNATTPFTIPPDYKSQLELQQTLVLWQEAMMQAAVTANVNNNNNNNKSNNNSNNNNLSVMTTSGMNNHANSKIHHYPHNQHSTNGRYSHVAKKLNSSSARTSPISPNFQPHPQQRNAVNNNHEYLSASGYASSLSNHHHQYNQQRSQPQQQSVKNNSGPHIQLKSENQTPIDNDYSNNKPKPKVTCKSLINLLSNSKRKQEQSQELSAIKRCLSPPSPNTQPQKSKHQQQHSHLLAALENPPNIIPHLVPIPPNMSPATSHPIDLSGRHTTSKLKVKQHLVDPALTPRLLKQEVVQHAEAVSSTDKSSHPQLWHPLFGSQKTSYNSPWQWTTVMVNGE